MSKPDFSAAAHILQEALLPLADDLPSSQGDVWADPADDGPVILAWGVKQLAERLADELARQGWALVQLSDPAAWEPQESKS